MTAWSRSQQREAKYDDAEWGIRHSRDYWLKFLKLDEIKYPALEVGCGDSGLWRFDPAVTGLDPIDYSGLAPNFAQGRAEALPFRGKQFQTVLCVNALDHTEDPERAVREMRRVGRRLVLWSYVFPHESYRILYRPHPHALTMSWISRALEGMRKDYWGWISPWQSFSKTSGTAAKVKLAAAEALGVRALLIHAENPS